MNKLQITSFLFLRFEWAFKPYINKYKKKTNTIKECFEIRTSYMCFHIP